MTLVKRKRLGDLLLESGLATQEQVLEALERQARVGGRFGQSVVELGYASESQVADLLANHWNVKRVELDKVHVDKDVLALISDDLMERYEVFPLAVVDGKLQVAMVDPKNLQVLDDLRRILQREFEPCLTTPGELQRAFHRHDDMQNSTKDVLAKYAGDRTDDVASEIEDVSDSVGVRLVNLTLEYAVRDGASDIHIEPGEKVTVVRQRIDGRLRTVDEFPRRVGNDVVSRIKVMSQLDITNRRTPQDGRLRADIQGRPFDLRVSTLPTIHGEKVAIRILSAVSDVVPIDELSFQPENVRTVRRMLSHSEGMILVTGPTGTGKTTTLYSFLHELNAPDVNIITIEDPVEIRVTGINQVGINPRAGLTFAGALRSVLRQDPDIVMVGEMRDQETAEIAVRAALTGHLVLSTLHTNSAAATLGRLLDMGIPAYLVAGTVVGIIAQRLVRRLCFKCRRPVSQLSPDEERFLGPGARGARLYEAAGCPVCKNTGFSGRLAIEEVLPMGRELKRLVRDNASEEQIVATAEQVGFISLRQSGIRRVLAGETTAREVMAVAHRVAEDEQPFLAFPPPDSARGRTAGQKVDTA